MVTDMTSRRAFIASLIATAGLPTLGWADAGSPAYLAAAKENGGFVLHGLSVSGISLFRIALPARGHAACAHPIRPEAVAFARRPGTFALVIDCVGGRVIARLTPPDGRQFNGHGAFTQTGDLLMTSEVVADTSEGRIGLWDGRDYSRIGEWSSGGVGPHDMKRLPDGRFVIANGGIQTDPTDRSKLNLATMRPNLTLLSPQGVLLDQVELGGALAQNSIRHLAISPGGTVAFAMQWEGDPAEPVPQLGLWTPGTPPRLCPPDDAQALVMQGYAGSIAFSGDGAHVAITSPKGGAVMIFAADGTPVATHRRTDLCGIAPGPKDFVLTDGLGALWDCGTDGLALLTTAAAAWDNHLITLI
jgi:hypothetical protein